MASTDAGYPETTAELIRTRPLAAAAFAVAIIGGATILGAWFFQYVLGYMPCALCYEQRYPYYFGIPLALMVLLGDQYGASRKVLVGAMAAIALGMLWNTYLGVYHSGVEWKLWAGPTDCAGTLGDIGASGGLLGKINTIKIPRCDEAAWRFLGISLAGYNAVISLALAAVAAWGAAMEWRGSAQPQA